MLIRLELVHCSGLEGPGQARSSLRVRRFGHVRVSFGRLGERGILRNTLVHRLQVRVEEAPAAPAGQARLPQEAKAVVG